VTGDGIDDVFWELGDIMDQGRAYTGRLLSEHGALFGPLRALSQDLRDFSISSSKVFDFWPAGWRGWSCS
jgi:hypothetical protein